MTLRYTRITLTLLFCLLASLGVSLYRGAAQADTTSTSGATTHANAESGVISPRAATKAAKSLAATITVNSTAQEVTQASPTGVANGNCTLGEAILATNTGAAVDGCNPAGGAPYTIVLQAGATYTLTQRGDADNYYGFNGLPPVRSQITILGNGAIIERAAGAPSFRLFAVAARSATGTVLGTPGNLTLEDVTLRGGLAQGGRGGDSFGDIAGGGGGGGGAGLGGAILNQGTLTIRRSTLAQNTAQGGAGGSRVSGGFGAGAGGGGLGGNGGDSTIDNSGGSGGGGFGGNGGLGTPGEVAPSGGGEGGGRTATGNNGVGAMGGERRQRRRRRWREWR